MWDLWWTKWHWGRFSLIAPQSPSSIIWGWYSRPVVVANIKWTQSHPTKKRKNVIAAYKQASFIKKKCSCHHAHVDLAWDDAHAVYRTYADVTAWPRDLKPWEICALYVKIPCTSLHL
jgi:hypothetical protein